MESDRINIWWLFLGGTILLTTGMMLRSFPVFVFIGLAPFFAILDHTIDSENFWEHAELILIGLAIAFFAAFQFDSSKIVSALIYAILFTFPFIGFAFVHENLGSRTGKFIVILIWLGIEYLLVKLQWPVNNFFLADSLTMWPNWTRWNNETGYLGGTLWILTSNWLVYASVLRNGVNWPLITLTLLMIAGPLVYSLMLDGNPILRSTMISLYNDSEETTVYATKGELVARTCAWVSILIMVFAGVKSKTAK